MLTVVNESPHEIVVAIAFRNSGDGKWSSRGWWTIPAFSELPVLEPEPGHGNFHFYARTMDGKENTFLRNPVRQFRTRAQPFTLQDADRRCKKEDPLFEPFDATGGELRILPVEMARAEEALNAMVGLDRVKELVFKRRLWMEMQLKRRLNNIQVPPIRLHLAFKGKPGTGKTSVARIFGDIYKGLGLLSKGHVVEIDGRGLIAAFVGQTAQKTNDLVQSALDGVLFIDEAYALHHQDTPQDFGREAVATLMKAMEDYRDRLAVILAGYPADIEELLNSNRGLRSRVATEIDFDDFTGGELLEIFERHVRNVECELDSECRGTLQDIFGNLVNKAGPAFGNARLVETLFQEMDEKRAVRIFDNKLDLLHESYLVDDIPQFYFEKDSLRAPKLAENS